MGKIIRLTESELTNILRKIISEQNFVQNTPYPTSDYLGKGGGFERQTKYKPNPLPCVPYLFSFSIQELLKQNYDKTFLKTVLGVIGRETDFGEGNRFKYTSLLKLLWAKMGGQTSVGFAQIKPESVKQCGISVSDLETARGSIVGAYNIIKNNYKTALNTGYSPSEPSVNFNEGTGNAALDIAIAAYNLGGGKIKKYCKTNDKKVMKPCVHSGKTIDGYTVTSEYVKNYLPNYKSQRWDNVQITSHGYVKEVADKIKKFSCF
jgi:hypothetical protein